MTEPARHYINEFDPHFRVLYELMAFKVREILLVSSPYDAYIMEEDGSLAMRIIHEYQGLNLSRPPRITRVPTPARALEMLERKEFDLVLTMPNLGRMDCNTFGARVRERFPDLPVILLAHSAREAAAPFQADCRCFLDRSFVWCCNSDVLLAIVKSVEDRKNVDADTRRAMVRVILLVEDDPAQRSRILSLLYGELVQQTQAVLDEGLNDQHRLIKMRARPKILLAETYEEALELFTRYRSNIFAVMSDVRFPKGGKVTADAGIQLARKVRDAAEDLPVLLFSSEPANAARAEAVSAVFALKDNTTIHRDIHAFLLDYLGFGDFIFRLPDGEVVGRAGNLHEFEQMLRTVPAVSVRYHASCNHFFNWVMARAETALASRLHKHHFREVTDPELLREDIIFKVHALRRMRQRGIVARFDRDTYDPDIMDFVRIGQGSLGGKARGMAFIGTRLLQAVHQDSILARVTVRVPQTCVITTDGFDDFVSHNRLMYMDGMDDEAIAALFLEAEMPAWLAADLRGYLEKIDYPLSVRSSSMLEDAQSRPYAGLYSTFMLANAHPDFEVRLAQLFQAVKLVYASTWFEGPRSFSRSVGQVEEDSMAVILQRLVGNRYGASFYPAMSGVAQSFNFYPVEPMRAEDGVASIALGFGKTVVEGERSLRFAPPYPENLPQFSTIDDILENSQRRFYCLDCRDPAAFHRDNANLVRRDIDEAAEEFPVRLLCSTYFPEEHRIRDTDLPGRKVLTFAPVLKYDFFPLAEVVTELLAVGREGMGCDVEIEFGVDLREDPDDSVFYFLQIRPVVTGHENRDVTISAAEREKGLLFSDQALGHGLYRGIRDIVYVRPERFDVAATREIAREIGTMNRQLQRDDASFLLIGPGRWGSADSWLGIPVQWGDIAGAAAIVEIQGLGVEAEPSQGSHFFHNITSLGIPYLMVRDKGSDGPAIDWDRLAACPSVRETDHVRHVRLETPLLLKVDGRKAEAVVLYDEKDERPEVAPGHDPVIRARFRQNETQ